MAHKLDIDIRKKTVHTFLNQDVAPSGREKFFGNFLEHFFEKKNQNISHDGSPMRDDHLSKEVGQIPI